MNVTLSVLSGLHQGAAATFEHAQIALGSDAFSTDITLLDTDILPVHCRFTPAEEGLILSESYSETPLCQGHRPLHPGDVIRWNKPFECAGVRLRAQLNRPARTAPRRRWWLLSLLLPAVLIPALLLLWRAPSGPETDVFLSAPAYRCLAWQQQQNQWVVSGFATRAAENELIAFFTQRDLAYRMEIINPDSGQKKLSDWLASQPNNHLTAAVSETCGHLDILGIRAPHQQENNFTEALPAALIPSDLPIDDKSTITDEYIKKLDSLINTRRLNQVILDFTFTAHAFRVSLRHEAGEAEKQALTALLDEFNREFDFRYRPEFTTAPVPRPALAVRAISLGKVPYVILTDGQRYQAGSQPDADTLIVSIDKEQMVLRYKNERYIVRFHDDHDEQSDRITGKSAGETAGKSDVKPAGQ